MRLFGRITQLYYCARYELMRVMHKLCSCIICSRQCTGTLCDTCCAKLMPYVRSDRAYLTGGDIADAKFHSIEHTTERVRIPPIDKEYTVPRELPMFATWFYDENIKKLFLAYKNKGVHIASYKFAHAVYSTFGEAMRFVQIHRRVDNENVYIVPLPSHPKHEKKLGFKPTGIISRYLAFLFQCNYAPILFRTHSLMQKQLQKSQRWKNMHNALHVKPHALKAIKNAQLMVLFDDVITTSATMYAAYQKIQKAFPRVFVIGVALSRVKHPYM